MDSEKNYPVIIDIPSIPIVQSNTFPTSQLKFLIPDSHLLPGEGYAPEIPEDFSWERALIPEFTEIPELLIAYPVSMSHFDV